MGHINAQFDEYISALRVAHEKTVAAINHRADFFDGKVACLRCMLAVLQKNKALEAFHRSVGEDKPETENEELDHEHVGEQEKESE